MTFEMYTASDGRHRWRILSEDRTLAESTLGYARREDAWADAERVRDAVLHHCYTFRDADVLGTP